MFGSIEVDLRPLPLATAHRLLTGTATVADRRRWHEQYPMAETVTALHVVVAASAAMGWSGLEPPQWWTYQVVVGGLVVGDAGFAGPPAAEGPAVVEISYAMVPDWRGRGVATAACRQLLELAWQGGADAVVAEVDPANRASVRVLTAAGFRRESPDRYRAGPIA